MKVYVVLGAQTQSPCISKKHSFKETNLSLWYSFMSFIVGTKVLRFVAANEKL